MDAVEENIVVEEPILDDPQLLLGNTSSLGQLLKFPVERMSTQGIKGKVYILRLV